MLGTCDNCYQKNRKLKYLYHNDSPLLAVCRYGCENRRSIPSAQNRARPFIVLSIQCLQKSIEKTVWEVKLKDERGRIKTVRLNRRGYETVETLRSSITRMCTNAKQVPSLNLSLYYD